MSEFILETEWTSHILAKGVQRYKWSQPVSLFWPILNEAAAAIQSIINAHVNKEQVSSYCLQKYL